MALINRVVKLFRADINAVLDNIEEPELLLKQAIREMQDDLFESEKQVNTLEAELLKIAATETRLKKSIAAIKPELDLCFQSEKHDLARSLIKRRLETERFYEQLTEKRKSVQQCLLELGDRQQEKAMQLESMQQKADLLIRETHSTNDGIYNNWEIPKTAVSADDIEIAFLNEQQRRA